MPSSSDRSVQRGCDSDDRPALQKTKQFDKALARLGSTDQEDVSANLEEFEKDWMSGVSIADLYARWDYKPLSVPKSCRQHGLRQIKPTRNTRIWMAKSKSKNIELLLFVIRKTSQAKQAQIIRKLCSQLSS